MERIKFYSEHDLSTGYHLQKLEERLNYYQAREEPKDINDYIELYNIKKYLDKNICLVEWSQEDMDNLKAIFKPLYPQVPRFFKSISDDTIIEFFSAVDEGWYCEDFWEIFEKFGCYKNIAPITLSEVLSSAKMRLHQILPQAKIVQYFSQQITEYMQANHQSAELLIEQYESWHISKREKYYFPAELDKEQIISNYIASEAPNVNYLQLIANIQSNKDAILISDQIRLKAQRRATVEIKKLFAGNQGMPNELSVTFTRGIEEEAIVTTQGISITAKYSSKWIENNRDYATLLNNFIYLFGLVDGQMRFEHVAKVNLLKGFSKILVLKSDNAYPTGTAFEIMQNFSLLQIHGYYYKLSKLNIRIEALIEWFFKEYLLLEFEQNGFYLRMPTEKSAYWEKCHIIMPALESVLKQFTMIAKEGSIDFELLQMSSQQLRYDDIPSMLECKYVYGKKQTAEAKELANVNYLFFSDQCMLCYCKRNEEEFYRNFFELLQAEKLQLDDIEEYQKDEIEWLIDKEYLVIRNGFIDFQNKREVLVLRDLYFNEVISYWHCNEPMRAIIDTLAERGLVEFGTTLFSKPESDYINYLLNKAAYNNGLDLRNKYSHMQPHVNQEDEKIDEYNYMIFLRLFILAVIKINDEFCLMDKKIHSFIYSEKIV